MSSAIVKVSPLGFPWETIDPFLFCVYHDDKYPKGNAAFGPDASLAGRNIGNDFVVKDGWRMYHGDTVPGFPSHPHRGFETVTIVRKGLIDHSDSLGAAARFGGGDVQWLTAGKGIVHSEMFPLLDGDRPNPLELFQIWLNLPARSKMADPHFTMFWSEQIPHRAFVDAAGRSTDVAVIAGRLTPVESILTDADGDGDVKAPASGVDAAVHPASVSAEPIEALAPPPDSWASAAEGDVAIWTLKMEPRATWTLPAASSSDTRRQLYFFKGASMVVDGREVTASCGIELRGDASVSIQNGDETAELLMLQGRPIGEKVAQYGPFVMNTEAELRQAFADYQRTAFGGWPWPANDPVHGSERERFAKYGDGHVERLAIQPA